MSFIIQPTASGPVITPPVTAGGFLYGDGTNALVSSAGTAGQLVVSGGSGAPTFTNPPLTVNATASGAITAEFPVVVNTDGTVSQVAAAAVAFSTGSLASTGGRNSTTNDVCSVYHTQQDKLVYFFKDQNSDLVGYVGTVNGTSITWGSKQTIATTLGTGSEYLYPGAVYCPSTNRIYLTCTLDNTAPTNVLYTLSVTGNTITLVSTDSGWWSTGNGVASQMLGCYDEANNVVVFTYADSTQVGTMRGSLPSPFGLTATSTTSLGSFMTVPQPIYNPVVKRVVILLNDTALGNTGRSIVANFATTTPTVGTRDTWYSSSIAQRFSGCYVSDDQSICVVFYNNAGNATRAVAGRTTLSNSMNWGTTVAGFAGNSFFYQTAYNSSLGLKSVGCVYTVSGGTVRYVSVTVSNTVPTFGSSDLVSSTTSNSVNSLIAYGSTFIPQIYSNAVSGTFFNYGVVITPAQTLSNLTSENFIGFSRASYTNGQTATVKTFGNTSTQSGLTTGQIYYVQRDGTISTTADSPIVVAGTAVSSTSLIIEG